MNSNETFDLLIIYWDGSSHVVKDVDNYGNLANNNELFYYIKNDFRSFIPVDKVNFIGRYSDYNNTEAKNESKS